MGSNSYKHTWRHMRRWAPCQAVAAHLHPPLALMMFNSAALHEQAYASHGGTATCPGAGILKSMVCTNAFLQPPVPVANQQAFANTIVKAHDASRGIAWDPQLQTHVKCSFLLWREIEPQLPERPSLPLVFMQLLRRLDCGLRIPGPDVVAQFKNGGPCWSFIGKRLGTRGRR